MHENTADIYTHTTRCKKSVNKKERKFNKKISYYSSKSIDFLLY